MRVLRALRVNYDHLIAEPCSRSERLKTCLRALGRGTEAPRPAVVRCLSGFQGCKASRAASVPLLDRKDLFVELLYRRAEVSRAVRPFFKGGFASAANSP
jgi:hypothetical protein